MSPSNPLPETFLREIKALEPSYLQHDDPILQSGFGGGVLRWRAEREPILDAVTADGDFLDIGCANGYLLECLMKWGMERGFKIIPYGLDIGPRLILLARKRLPHFENNFFVGNAWDWQPQRQFRYVYTLCDYVPHDYLKTYLHKLLSTAVESGGRLIIGSYGSKSRQHMPFDIAGFLKSNGFEVIGTTQVDNPPISTFAWVDSNF